MTSPVPSQDIIHPIFAGIDVGGTSIKVGLVDDQGQTLAKTSFPTNDHSGVPDAVQRMKAAIEQLASQAKIDFSQVVAIGLGTPGTMDIPSGLILEPPNLPGWRNYPIRDELQQACGGKPVAFANDAGAAAYGEYWVGSGRHFSSVVLFTLGTGVGGGVIVGDLSIDGAHSHGSEFGHIIVDTRAEANICSCGQPGHLEAYASATAVVARTQTALQDAPQSSLRKRIDQGETLSALMVAQEAQRGDPLALQLVDETAHHLATGIDTVTHVIDPDAVILGGAMNFGGESAELGKRFLERVRDRFRKLTFPVQAKNTTIVFASLGGDAGYIGTAGLARLHYQKLSRDS